MTAATAMPFPSVATNPPSSQTNGCRICILGGGFGGLYTALRLAQFPWDDLGKPEITLVDRNDRFVFLPLLYELVTEEMEDWEVAPRFEDLLTHTGIRFCHGDVAHIDLDHHRITLQSTETLSWDRLVLSLGGETPLDSVTGAETHALPFRTVHHAHTLKAKLKTLESNGNPKIRVAIVGGGYSGVELACKLADRLGDRGRVRLIERNDQILRFSPTFNQQTAQDALRQRKVWIDLETTVTAVGKDFLDLRYRNQTDRISIDLVLWTIGNRAIPLVQQLPLPQNDRGQIQTESTLQVMNNPHLYALGDLAATQDATGQTIPSTAQAAFQQADYAAWNIWASKSQEVGIDRPLLPFRYHHLGEMMTLGKDHATLSGLGIHLQGSLAHLARRLIYLQRMPTWEHQLRVGMNWLLNSLSP